MATKIFFDKLMGNHYSLETKMNVLNWMLETALPFEDATGYLERYGLNRFILDYSANNWRSKVMLPNSYGIDGFFDLCFARAIYKKNCPKCINDWRKQENVFSGRCRVLPFSAETNSRDLWRIVRDIQSLSGALLKKEMHHPDYLDRTEPFIVDIQIYTAGAGYGSGWKVGYNFTFKETSGSGWDYIYSQEYTKGAGNNESIYKFLSFVLEDLNKRIIKNDPN